MLEQYRRTNLFISGELKSLRMKQELVAWELKVFARSRQKSLFLHTYVRGQGEDVLETISGSIKKKKLSGVERLTVDNALIDLE